MSKHYTNVYNNKLIVQFIVIKLSFNYQELQELKLFYHTLFIFARFQINTINANIGLNENNIDYQSFTNDV